MTPEQAGPILAATRPRLAVLHHLILNDASRPDIISAVRAGYPEVRFWFLVSVSGFCVDSCMIPASLIALPLPLTAICHVLDLRQMFLLRTCGLWWCS